MCVLSLPHRRSVTKAPTWPSCFAYPSLRAESSVSACWTPCSTRLVHTCSETRSLRWLFFNTRWKKWVMSEWWLIAAEKTASPEDGEQCYHHKAQVPSCVQWLIKRFPFFFFYCIYSCHGYVYVYVWSDTSNLLLFFVSLLWRTTWSLLQDCCWGWIPPQDQDTCVLWVWQKNRINEKKEAQCSPYALIVYAIMCCSRWK